MNLVLDSSGLKVEVAGDLVHEADEAPEGVHLVLHDVQNWGQQVRHALGNGTGTNVTININGDFSQIFG
jgi:hypothetical protein